MLRFCGNGWRRWRGRARAALAAFGLATVAGCGGPAPCGSPPCEPPVSFTASVEPLLQIVQAGETASFVVSVSDPGARSYQWLRDGVEIAGATQPTYRLVGTAVGDDGASFVARVTANDGKQASTGPAVLRVSSAPALRFEDGEFLPADWEVTRVSDPPQDGPTAVVARSASGGHPDAYLGIDFDLPAGQALIRVFHLQRAAAYDPVLQGAVLVADFGADCKSPPGNGAVYVSVTPMIEQAGRRFVYYEPLYCFPDWERAFSLVAVRADEFNLDDGPDCGPNLCRLDFSSNGAPLRLGFKTMGYVPLGSPAIKSALAVDNWTAAIWKK